MKIDSTRTPTSAVSETRPRTPVSTAPTEAAAEVHLSKLAEQLQSPGEASSFDAGRVAEIQQAITEGRLTINAEAVADRLIASARELVGAHKPS